MRTMVSPSKDEWSMHYFNFEFVCGMRIHVTQF